MSNGESLEGGAARPPLALIAGPTASGKSDLAVRVALALQEQGPSTGSGRAVVINADSAQVYADLAVLSARPTAEEMRGVEHRLFGTWDGAVACSAAEWAAAAKREIADAHVKDAVPILVGGTGLYLRTLLDGIAPVPDIDPTVRQAVRALETAAAYEALQREDPERAAALNPGDSTRIARALEVVRSTGRPLAEWQRESVGGIGSNVDLHAMVLLPERQELYARCDTRFATMLERGAVEEVRRLLARQLDPASPVMRAIGVPEIAKHLSGEWSLDQVGRVGAQATRNYAKRQYTWFRHQPPPEWTRVEQQSYNPAKGFEILLRTSGLT